MKHIIWATYCAASCLLYAIANLAKAETDIGQVIERSMPAVFRIEVEHFRNDQSVPIKVEEGTAFMISSNGYALTAAHVIADFRGAQEKRIRFCRDDSSVVCEIVAELVEIDEQSDVALLQVPGSGVWSYLPVGFSADIQKAREFIYLGFVNRRRTFNKFLVPNLRDAGMWRAELNTSPGTSGSPVLDGRGCVYGIILSGTSHQVRILPSGRFLSLVQNLIPTRARDECARGGPPPQPDNSSGTGTIHAHDGQGSSARAANTTVSRDGGLSEAQRADLGRLLDVASSYIIYHRGRFARNISYIGQEYLQSGLFFYPEQHRRLHSKLPQGERAAVAARYQEIREEIFTRYPELNRSTYSTVAAAFGTAARQQR